MKIYLQTFLIILVKKQLRRKDAANTSTNNSSSTSNNNQGIGFSSFLKKLFYLLKETSQKILIFLHERQETFFEMFSRCLKIELKNFIHLSSDTSADFSSSRSNNNNDNVSSVTTNTNGSRLNQSKAFYSNSNIKLSSNGSPKTPNFNCILQSYPPLMKGSDGSERDSMSDIDTDDESDVDIMGNDIAGGILC